MAFLSRRVSDVNPHAEASTQRSEMPSHRNIAPVPPAAPPPALRSRACGQSLAPRLGPDEPAALQGRAGGDLARSSKRARWHAHFTPTSSSWLNLVASWFSQLTSRRLKKGTFSSVAQLEDEIGIWTENWNDDPQPFIWRKPADEIIAKVQRGRSKLASLKSATDHL